MKQTVQFFGGGVFSPLRKCLPHFRKAGLAALLMLSASGMRAADSPGVKFNSGVRYSQWAIDSRANDFYANTTAFGLAKYKSDGATIDKARKDTKGKLDYVPGLVAKSMIEAADYYQSFDWSKPWFASVKEYGDTYYKSVPNTGGSLDDLNAVKLYIGIYNDKAYASDADKTNATTALDRAKAGLIAHNNSNSIQSGTLAGDAVVGGWFHKADYNNQMWLDGAYMGSALLGQLINFYGNNANIFGSKEADWQMAFKQLNIVWDMCWNSTDKLMYHAFEANAGTGSSNSNANTWYGLNGKTQPYTFHSAAYWGRANAWYLFALVDVLEAMKNDGQESTANYATLKQHLADLAEGIKARQSAEGGWYQLLDKDNTFTATSYNSSWSGKPSSVTNFIETSATTLFSAAFFKAVRLGLLDDTYKDAAKKAFELVVTDYTYLDADNNLEIWGSSRSAGLGGTNSCTSGEKKFRDGSNEYYLLGYDVPMVTKADGITEGKVLGGFIMAATEYERAYQNQDAKQILFARDLAPEYDFTTTAGSLDATAYGSGTVAYQWYKDGAKVADATSATFAPTENGEYYCTATVDGTSITTSTANVKAKTTTDGGDDAPSTTTTIFSMSVNSDASASVAAKTELSLADYANVTGGTVSVYNGKSSAQSMIANGAIVYTDKNTQYVKVTLNSALAKGDVLKLTTDGTRIYATTTDTKATTINVATEYTVDDALAGATTLYLWTGDNSKKISAINITRVGSSEPTTTQYTVTATAQDGGGVTITSGDKEIASGSKVDKGTALTFTAKTSAQVSDYDFVGWTVNGKDVEGTDPTYTVASLDADITVLAKFTRMRANINFPVPANGTSTATLNGETLTRGQKVNLGSDVTFSATPNTGYKFSYWEIHGDKDIILSENISTNPYTITIDHDYNMKAMFVKESETPVTPSTGNASFAKEDLILLDSAPTGNEKSLLTDGGITITAGNKVNGGDNSGLKMSKSDGTTFTISAANDAKITKIVVTQKDNSRTLNYSPAGTESVSENVYTYDYSSNKPSSITVSANTSGNVYVTDIKVYYETTAAKTDLSASFAKSDVDAIVGAASVDLPALTVKAGEATLTEGTDYTVVYKSNDENVVKIADGKLVFVAVGTTTVDATVTPADATKYNATTASFNVNVKKQDTPVDPTKESVIYDLNTNVGETADGKNCSHTSDKMTFGSNFSNAERKYIAIAPANGGFKAGDVITLHGYCDSKNKSGVVIYSDPAGESIFKTNELATSANGGSDYTFTITEDCDSLFFGRFGGGSTYLTSLTVKRPAATEKTRLTASFAERSKVVVNTTTEISLPALAVKAGDATLTNEQYNVTYVSNAESVATVSGDVVTVKGTGIATITATVTPVDATQYEGCTATFQLTVKAQTPLGVEAMDISINANDAEVKQPLIKIYDDNDKLLTLGTDYTLSFAFDNDNVSADQDGVFSVKGTSRNWTEGVTTVTITATPTTSLGEIYTAGTLQFTYSVVKGLLKPVFGGGFNGQTIKLSPNHTETINKKPVNAHIFTVPLLYDGEDVSAYFDYTFTLSGYGSDTKTTDGNKLTYTHKETTDKTVTVTVSAEPHCELDKDGNVVGDDYHDVYSKPDPISFTLDIKSAYAVLDVTLDPEEITMYTGTAEGLPDVTVKKDGTTLDDNSYTIAWTTNMPNVVGVDNGRLLGRSEGVARVRVLITGDNIESTTRFVTVTVDDPALYRVKTAESYGNQRVMWNQNKTISVTLGAWMFPTDVNYRKDPDYKSYFSNEGMSSTYKWNDTSSRAKWKMTGFDYYVPGDNSKNARNENASNSMPETTLVGDYDYSHTGTIVDPMFNVPCSGSYLVFNPKTNGQVNVHIFQNGVFDAKDSDYQYRPQRRVFVMDEAGNFVSSTPEIENANGKPTGGKLTLSSYKWDMGTKGAPTVELVNSHFKGLDNFVMSETEKAFQNGVYESNLSNDIAPNKAAQNNPDRKGVNGWCVLADSPVTYNFRVQAGKTYYLYNFGSKIGFYGFSFEEDAAPVVDQLEFNDNQTNEIKPTEAGHVAQVKINRKLKANQWTTLVLPFSLTKPQVDAIFGETYGVRNENGSLVSNEQGTQILYFDRIEGSKAVFVRHAYNTVVAGKPFLIKPTKDVECINTADCADFPYVTIESEKPAEWCKGDGYAWVSSYSNDMTVKAGDCFISGSKGEFMNYTGADSPMPGFRGYLKRTDYGVQDAKPLRAATGSYVADDTTSAIDGIFLDSDGSAAVEAIADGKVYNMSGQVVATSAAALKSLPSGVYMLNGKKIVK